MALNHVWRDASRTPAFFGKIDSRSGIPVVLFFVHMKVWTLVLSFVGGLFFGVLGMFGYELPVLYRKLRAAIRGRRIYAMPWWKMKKRRYN